MDSQLVHNPMNDDNFIFHFPTFGFRMHDGSRVDRKITIAARKVQETGPVFAIGIAICSEKDNFNKDLGKAKAKGRSLSDSAVMFTLDQAMDDDNPIDLDIDGHRIDLTDEIIGNLRSLL